MWFVHPLSINHYALEILLEKPVATKSTSSSSFANWGSTSFCSLWFTSCCSLWFLQMTASCLSWLHLLHLASGLLQHLNGGWPNLLQCLQGGLFLLLWLLCATTSPFSCWFCLIWLPLFLQPPLWLAIKAPSIAPSCLMALLCSCACKAFKSSAREIFYRYFVFSRVVMVASNLSVTVTSSFSTILESFNTCLLYTSPSPRD